MCVESYGNIVSQDSTMLASAIDARPIEYLRQASKLLEDFVYASAGDGDSALYAHLILVAADLDRLANRIERQQT